MKKNNFEITGKKKCFKILLIIKEKTPLKMNMINSKMEVKRMLNSRLLVTMNQTMLRMVMPVKTGRRHTTFRNIQPFTQDDQPVLNLQGSKTSILQATNLHTNLNRKVGQN